MHNILVDEFNIVCEMNFEKEVSTIVWWYFFKGTDFLISRFLKGSLGSMNNGGNPKREAD